MPVNSQTATVLGLFPQFQNGELGGIQESARVAWQALSRQCSTKLICYSKDITTYNGTLSPRDSQLRAVLEALRSKDPHELVLVWQIGLLKLLPFLRSRNGGRTAVYLHGIEAWRKQDWLTTRLAKQIGLFLCNSEYTWQRFININPAFSSVNHRIVPLGLNNSLSISSSTPLGPPAALMLSRISGSEAYKGHREVIDSWPLVLERIPDAQLWIAGDGDQRPALERQVEGNNLTESIRFFGKVAEDEKRRLLSASRCLVMPSRGEGFGLVYLEAMRVGRPCLVSNVDAGREVVNPPEAGLAADPDNIEEIAGCLSRLLKDGPDWRNWSARARLRYEQNYTAAHFQERLLRALFAKTDGGRPVTDG